MDTDTLYEKIEKALEAIKDIEIEAIGRLDDLNLKKLSELKGQKTEDALSKLKEIRDKINLNKN